MKILLTAFFLCICTSQLVAQPTDSNSKFTISQIGLTFSVPPGFTMIDSSSHTLNNIPEITVWMKQFIFKKDDASFVIGVSQSTQKNIDWNNIYIKESKHFYDQTRIRKPETQFDSVSTIVLLGEKPFNKFIVTGKEKM